MPLENRFIFFPDPWVAASPSDVGLAYEDIFLNTRDGEKINAWFVPKEGTRATMLWFHGNAGNIGHRVAQIKLYHDRWQVNQMLVEYRGYGKSSGTVSEEGTYEDGRAAIAHLFEQKGVSSGELIIFGRSLGAAVAVQMATESESAGLILESPFTSVRDMAQRHYPVIGNLLPLKIRYDSIHKIKDVHVPLLILHGDRDRIVPVQMGRQLFEAANEPKHFFPIDGAGHNDILFQADETYHEAVVMFIGDAVKER